MKSSKARIWLTSPEIAAWLSRRDWVARFGVQFAAQARRDRPRPADKWHLDEVVIPIEDRKHWFWRAVDANGGVLEIPFQSRRSKSAAERFFQLTVQSQGPTAGECSGQAAVIRCG